MTTTNTLGGISTAVSPTSDQETTVIPTVVVEQCSNCKSVRRRSLYDDEDEQHVSKKPNLSPQPISSSAAVASTVVTTQLADQFTKIHIVASTVVTTQLADQFTKIHISPPSILRRTISAPNPLVFTLPPTFLNPNSPEKQKTDQSPVNGINLNRCISDPSPILNFPIYSPETKTNTNTTASPASVTETPKPSLPPTRRQILRRRKRTCAMKSRKLGEDLSKGESPFSKEPKEMKEIMNVTNQCISHSVQESEDQEQASEITHNTENPKGSKIEEEEAVSVEKIGECLMIEFKCDCTRAYQILLHGDACYYKLI